jgi:hypothetical protein
MSMAGSKVLPPAAARTYVVILRKQVLRVAAGVRGPWKFHTRTRDQMVMKLPPERCLLAVFPSETIKKLLDDAAALPALLPFATPLAPPYF